MQNVMTLRQQLGAVKRYCHYTIVKRTERFIRIATGEEEWYAPQVRCRTERHGSQYGGWTVPAEYIKPGMIVYSVGIGNDITFDLSLIARYEVDVYAFDPTSSSIEWLQNQDLPAKFHYYPHAVSHVDDVVQFYAPKMENWTSYSLLAENSNPTKSTVVEARRVVTLMDTLGHERVDILKLDIEGAEYQVVDDLLQTDVQIGMLLIEFHHRFPTIGFEATKQAIFALNRNGYQIFAISPSGEDYSFIHESVYSTL